MRIKIGLWLLIISSMFVHFSPMPGVAQSTQRIGGGWFATEGKIGLVLRKGDFHPYFMYGECEKPRRQVRLNLEIEPKLFGDAVAREEYIIVRWANENSKVDSIVEGIFLNEAGRYTWSPFLMVGMGTVNFWLHASRLEFTVGVREKDAFNARQTYLLPDEDRQAALISFIRFCFSDVAPAPR